jgi:hypothetical protein
LLGLSSSSRGIINSNGQTAKEIDSSEDQGKYQILDLRSQIAPKRWVGLSLEVEPSKDQGKYQISDLRSQIAAERATVAWDIS